MKAGVLIVCLGWAVAGLAQSGAPGGSAAGSAPRPVAGSAQQAAPAASPYERMRASMAAQMQQQSMQEMRNELEIMKRQVLLMHSEALSISDSHARDAINTNADLWDQLIAALEKQVARAQQMQQMQSSAAPPAAR